MNSADGANFPFHHRFWDRYVLLRQLNPRDPTEIISQSPMRPATEISFGSAANCTVVFNNRNELDPKKMIPHHVCSIYYNEEKAGPQVRFQYIAGDVRIGMRGQSWNQPMEFLFCVDKIFFIDKYLFSVRFPRNQTSQLNVSHPSRARAGTESRDEESNGVRARMRQQALQRANQQYEMGRVHPSSVAFPGARATPRKNIRQPPVVPNAPRVDMSQSDLEHSLEESEPCNSLGHKRRLAQEFSPSGPHDPVVAEDSQWDDAQSLQGTSAQTEDGRPEPSKAARMSVRTRLEEEAKAMDESFTQDIYRFGQLVNEDDAEAGEDEALPKHLQTAKDSFTKPLPVKKERKKSLLNDQMHRPLNKKFVQKTTTTTTTTTTMVEAVEDNNNCNTNNNNNDINNNNINNTVNNAHLTASVLVDPEDDDAALTWPASRQGTPVEEINEDGESETKAKSKADANRKKRKRVTKSMPVERAKRARRTGKLSSSQVFRAIRKIDAKAPLKSKSATTAALLNAKSYTQATPTKATAKKIVKSNIAASVMSTPSRASQSLGLVSRPDWYPSEKKRRRRPIQKYSPTMVRDENRFDPASSESMSEAGGSKKRARKSRKRIDVHGDIIFNTTPAIASGKRR